MNAHKFTAYRSDSYVASGVTFLVSAWFLIAAGLILADSSAYAPRIQVLVAPMSEATATPAEPAATQVAIAPEARLTIKVEARRSAT